jgi:ABC-type molybdenum transport system ATPase subunit/photorepair protein PhrA
MTATPPLLELENVTVVRGGRAALRNVTLRIDAGERVCILGPNGSGKSTLVKTITRECYPLADGASRIAILGEERWNVAELRTHRAMRELARSPLGLVLVTHDVSEIIPEIHRVVLLREGRVFADGPRNDVLTEGHLAALFGVPVRLVTHDGYLHAL